LDSAEEIFASFNPSILYDLEKYHPKAHKKFTEHHNKFLYAIVKDNLERGIADGLYREEINIDIITKYRLGMIFMIFNDDHFPHGKYALSKIMNEITDNFLHGLVTAKGLKLIQKYKQQRRK
jgi:superfamily I DNA and/or RNA helicase